MNTVSKLELEYLYEFLTRLKERVSDDDVGIIWDMDEDTQYFLDMIGRELNASKTSNNS